jgi:hypothetical protein
VALAGQVMVELCDRQCLEEVDHALNALEGIEPDTQLAGTDVMIGFLDPQWSHPSFWGRQERLLKRLFLTPVADPSDAKKEEALSPARYSNI